MKRIALCTLAVVLFSTPALFAQELPSPGNLAPFDPFLQDAAPHVRPGASSFGHRGYAARQELVFRKAAQRAAERQQRIALNKALGYSPLRPPSSSVPAMGSPIPRPVVVWTRSATLYAPRTSY